MWGMYFFIFASCEPLRGLFCLFENPKWIVLSESRWVWAHLWHFLAACSWFHKDRAGRPKGWVDRDGVSEGGRGRGRLQAGQRILLGILVKLRLAFKIWGAYSSSFPSLFSHKKIQVQGRRLLVHFPSSSKHLVVCNHPTQGGWCPRSHCTEPLDIDCRWQDYSFPSVNVLLRSRFIDFFCLQDL